MEIRLSYDRLISTMGFPILVRQYLYIESGPRVSLHRHFHELDNCFTDVGKLLYTLALLYREQFWSHSPHHGFLIANISRFTVLYTFLWQTRCITLSRPFWGKGQFLVTNVSIVCEICQIHMIGFKPDPCNKAPKSDRNQFDVVSRIQFHCGTLWHIGENEFF